MSRFVPLALLLFVTLSGCAGATHTLDPADGPALRGALDGRSGTVVLLDGGRFRAHALRMDADTTSWFDTASGEMWAVPTAAIAEIGHRDRGRSAGRTAKAGALVAGVVLGVMLGAAGYDAGGCVLFCDASPTQQERFAGAASFGLAGALMGAASGAMYGAIGGALVNSPDRYVLAPGGGGQEEAVVEAMGVE